MATGLFTVGACKLVSVGVKSACLVLDVCLKLEAVWHVLKKERRTRHCLMGTCLFGTLGMKVLRCASFCPFEESRFVGRIIQIVRP